jgi:hypothetical protein
MWRIFYNMKGNKFLTQSSFRSIGYSITGTAKEIQNKNLTMWNCICAFQFFKPLAVQYLFIFY